MQRGFVAVPVELFVRGKIGKPGLRPLDVALWNEHAGVGRETRSKRLEDLEAKLVANRPGHQRGGRKQAAKENGKHSGMGAAPAIPEHCGQHGHCQQYAIRTQQDGTGEGAPKQQDRGPRALPTLESRHEAARGKQRQADREDGKCLRHRNGDVACGEGAKRGQPEGPAGAAGREMISSKARHQKTRGKVEDELDGKRRAITVNAKAAKHRRQEQGIAGQADECEVKDRRTERVGAVQKQVLRDVAIDQRVVFGSCKGVNEDKPENHSSADGEQRGALQAGPCRLQQRALRLSYFCSPSSSARTSSSVSVLPSMMNS